MTVTRLTPMYRATPEQAALRNSIHELQRIVRDEQRRAKIGAAPSYEGGLAAAQTRLGELQTEVAALDARVEAERIAGQSAAAAERAADLAWLDDRESAEAKLRDFADQLAGEITEAVAQLGELADKWWQLAGLFEEAADRWGVQTFPSDTPANPLVDGLAQLHRDAVTSRGEVAQNLVGTPAALRPLPAWLDREPGPTLEQRDAALDERGRREIRRSSQAAAIRARNERLRR